MNTKPGTARSSELHWFRSSHSGSSGGDCVEIAEGARTVQVRDSKSPHSPVLSVPTHQWAAFLTYAVGTAPPR